MKSEKILISFAIIIALFITIPLASAFGEQVQKTGDVGASDYPSFDVVNNFGIPFFSSTLENVNLTQHTQNCLFDECKSIEHESLSSSGTLAEDIRFLDQYGNNISIPNSLEYGYWENLSKIVNDTKTSCNNVQESNGTNEVCSEEIIGTHEELYQNYKVQKYELGQNVPIGDYDLIVHGNIPNGQKVDWQIKNNGIWYTLHAWWNASFQSKYQFNLTGTVPSNYTLMLNVTWVSGMNGDTWGDLRAVNGSETGTLPYWVDTAQSVANKSAIVWVMIQDNSSVYIYFGSPGATTTGDITKAFLLGDDFAGAVGSSPNAQWTQGANFRGKLNGDGTLNITATGATSPGSDSGALTNGIVATYGEQSQTNVTSYMRAKFTQTKTGGYGMFDYPVRNSSDAGGYLIRAMSDDLERNYYMKVAQFVQLSSANVFNDLNFHNFYYYAWSNGTVGWTIDSTSSFALNKTVTNFNTAILTAYPPENWSVDTFWVRKALVTDPTITASGVINIPVPNPILSQPLNNSITNSATVLFECNSTDSFTLTDIRLNVWNSTGTLIDNNATIISGNSNNTKWTNVLPRSDIYHWNCQVNDTSNLPQWNNTNYTLTVDTIKPQVQFVSPTPNSGASNGVNLSVNVTASDTNLANVTIYLYNSTFDIQNQTTSASSPYFLKYLLLADGLYFFNATATDLANNVNVTETRNITIDSTPPTVNFQSQTPVDIDTASLYTSGLFINYSITDNFGVNPSTVNLSYKTNNTLSDVTNYVNGTANIGFFVEGGTNVSSNWSFFLDDNDVYPAKYNLDQDSLMQNNAHSIFSLSGSGRSVKTEFLNVSNATGVNLVEFMANSTVGASSLNAFYCNSTYTTGNVNTNANCFNFQNFAATTGFTVTENGVLNNSKYNSVSMAINTTTGQVGTVKVTSVSFIVFMMTGNTGTWSFYDVANTARTTTTATSVNSGGAWTGQTFTFDQHFHQYTGTDAFYYFACANDTSGNQGCNATREDILETAGLPPSAPIITNPVAQGYNMNITINYTASVSPNGFAIQYYNISLLNSDQSFNKTIIGNNGLNLGYVWNSSTTGDGNYIIEVTAKDSQNQTSFGLSPIFSLDNVFPFLTITSPANASNFTTESVIVNYTASDTNLNSCWWTKNSGSTNTSITCGQNITGQTWSEGWNVVTVYANDTVNQVSKASVSFFVDSIAPVVTLNTPLNNSYTNVSSQVFNWSIVETNQKNSTLNVWNVTESLIYNTTIVGTTPFSGLCYQETANVSTSCGGLNTGTYAFIVSAPSTWVNPQLTYDGDYSTAGGIGRAGFGSPTSAYMYINYSKPAGSLSSSLWRLKGINTDSGGINDSNYTIPLNCWNQSPLQLRAESHSDDLGQAYVKGYCFDGSSWQTIATPNSLGPFNNQIYDEAMIWNISQSTYQAPFTLPYDGIFHWNVLAYDTLGNNNWSANNYTLTLDTVKPVINIYSPSGDLGLMAVPFNVTLNATTSDTNLNTCWYNSTFNAAPTKYVCNTAQVINVPNANTNTIYVYANDSADNIAMNSTTFGPDAVINSITYNASVYETSYQTFTMNASINSNFILNSLVYLNYSGVLYTATSNASGNETIFSAAIDIPTITTDPTVKSFNFIINLYNGTDTVNRISSFSNQTVNKIFFQTCGGTVNITTLNFTAYDEQNASRIRPYEFDGSFNYWLGSGTVKKEFNYTNVSTPEAVFCIQPANTYKIDSIIAYSAPNSSIAYTTRNWFYQSYPINQTENNVSMYLLSTAASTQFVLQVEDKNIQPITNVLVESQKCYPGTDQVVTSFKSRTDTGGTTSGNYEVYTGLYQFLITNQSNTLLAVTPCSKIVPQTSPFTIIFQVGTTYISPFLNPLNVTNLTQTLVYTASSRVLTYTYEDTSGNFSSAELVVVSANASGSSQPIICDNSNSQVSGIITCNVTSSGPGSYIATAYVHRSSQILVNQLTFAVQTFSSAVGYYGVFLGFFIILILSFAFKFNEIAGIWAVESGIIFTNLVGLISFGNVFITASLAVAIILTVVLER